MVVVLAFVAYAVALTIALARAGHRPSATPPIMPAASSVTRVLIIGGTGGTGRRLVAQALERGLVVTALARDPARLKIDHPRLTVLRGNVLDAAVVDAAVRGQEAVLCALGHKRFLGPTTILSAGTRNLLHAMTAHGVRRFVCETSLGLGDSAGRLGLLYTFFTIPVVLPNGERRGSIRGGARAWDFVWPPRISRADVAGFMLDQFESGACVRTAVGVSQG